MLLHFKIDEFTCKCGCQQNRIKLDFISKLDNARSIAGIPFVVNSGYRCKKHNKAVGGAPKSAHTMGIAADIKCDNSTNRYKIINACMTVGLRRIGIAGSFVHVDYDQTKPQNVIWLY